MRFINIRQHDMSDCGPACLAMIARYYKGNVSIAKIREEIGTNSMGTSLKALCDGAESIGFKTMALKSIENTKDDCLNEITLPCIAHMVVDKDLLHYVVIFKIKKNTVIISDPAEGVVELPRKQFYGLNNCEVKSKKYRWTGVVMLLSPTSNFQKNYLRGSEIKNLLNLLQPNKKLCIVITMISLLYTIINIGAAFYYKILIDKILPENAFENLILVSEAFLLLVLAKVILNVIRVDMSLILGKHINEKLAMGYYEHILTLPQCFFDNRKVGEISSRFQDVEIIQTLLSKVALTVCVDTIAVIVAGGLLYSQNKSMFFCVILICLMYIIVVFLFRKKYSVCSRKQLISEAQNNAQIIDFLNGSLTTKLYNAEDFSYKKVKKSFTTYLENVYKLGKLENLQYGLKNLIGFSGEIIIFCFGILNIFKGNMTIGELITFNALISYFFEPIRNLIDLQAELQTALIAEERIKEIMDLDSERNRTNEIIDYNNDIFNSGYDICFNNVSFGYNHDKMILNHISLCIASGSKIAIIGASGSGKSTIAKLLLKLYNYQMGHISVNGIDLQKINTNVLRNEIVYVSQNTFLFNVSILENLLLGSQNCDKEKIYEVCNIVNIHEYIMSLPFQYDTILEENGSNLSSGQKQRLVLARAVLKKPRILILDEATSNLDIELERIVNNSIKQYLAKSTIIFITHRPETAKGCDKVYVLENGQVIDR